MKNLLLVPFCLFAFVAWGQQNVKFEEKNFENNIDGLRQAVQNIDTGEVLYKMGKTRYNFAIPYFLAAEKFNPNNDQLNYLIGKCMLSSHAPDRTLALPYLQTAYKLNPSVAPDIHYLLGRAYHLNMQWEEAKQEYNTYLESLDPNKDPEAVADVKKKIEECNNGEELVKTPVTNIKIDNLGQYINSPDPEYGAIVTPDESEIIFTSRRPAEKGKNQVAPIDGLYMENVYTAFNQNGTWGEATNIGVSVNTTGQDAIAGVSTDGKTLYVYHGTEGGDIYVSHLQGNSWSQPEPIKGKINTHHEVTVSLAPDGKTLYFASSRPGGYGGNDIYVSVADANGVWGDAVNLGPVVNTKYNDEAMSIQPDGKTLYFSSQGHNSMGGYDIFKTTKNDSGTWTTPVNLGYPINGPDDDIFFSVASSGKHAYFSSIRKGGYGEKDIYMVTYLPPPAMLTEMYGTITDSVTHQPIAATIQVMNGNDSVIETVESDGTTGKYNLSVPAGAKYNVVVKAPGYLVYSTTLDLTDTSKKKVLDNIVLQPIKLNTPVALNNIFYDFAKATLRPESKEELNRLVDFMETNKTAKIRISGYTDSIGTIHYNQVLSVARAEAVVKYLEAHKISATRLSAEGYGKTHYAASNSTAEGRQKNRRAEFEVIEK